jgi:hypothetical protein
VTVHDWASIKCRSKRVAEQQSWNEATAMASLRALNDVSKQAFTP